MVELIYNGQVRSAKRLLVKEGVITEKQAAKMEHKAVTKAMNKYVEDKDLYVFPTKEEITLIPANIVHAHAKVLYR